MGAYPAHQFNKVNIAAMNTNEWAPTTRCCLSPLVAAQAERSRSMMKIAALLICSLLVSVVSMGQPGYSEGRKVNESLAKEVSSIYKVKKIETDPFVETKVGDYLVARTTYFYEWKEEKFAEKNEEEFIGRLDPWINSLEKKYGIWCQNRGFMYSKHAEEFSPTKIPGLNLVFKNRETKEVQLHLMVSIFHTSPKILALEATSIFPRKKLIEQDD